MVRKIGDFASHGCGSDFAKLFSVGFFHEGFVVAEDGGGPHPWPLSHRRGEGNRGELPAQLAVSPSWFVVSEVIADWCVPHVVGDPGAQAFLAFFAVER